MRRVIVYGTCEAAKGLRTLIERDDVLVHGRMRADLRIQLSDGDIDCPQVDGVDSEIARLIVKHLGELSPSGRVLVLYAAGEVHKDHTIAITLPRGEANAYAAEHALYRALLTVARPRRPWWKRKR